MRIKLQGNFFAGSEDYKSIVKISQQRAYITVARVRSGLARVRTGRADFFIFVLHVSGRLGLDLPRIAVEPQAGILERDGRQASVHVLIRAVDQNTVPINLKIGR